MLVPAAEEGEEGVIGEGGNERGYDGGGAAGRGRRREGNGAWWQRRGI